MHTDTLCAPKQMRTFPYILYFTYQDAKGYTDIQTNIHTYIHTYKQTYYIPRYVDIYIHTYITRLDIHTYI